jgi:hypothetical protein
MNLAQRNIRHASERPTASVRRINDTNQLPLAYGVNGAWPQRTFCPQRVDL